MVIKVALFGGSFDPIHEGHIEVVEMALENLDIDQLIVMPTFLNPFKKSFQSSPKNRYKTVKKTFEAYDSVVVSDFETNRKKATPTITTVEYLYTKYDIQKFYIIIGADNLASLHMWENIVKLKSLVEFVIASRDGIKIESSYKVLKVDKHISSSILRNDI